MLLVVLLLLGVVLVVLAYQGTRAALALRQARTSVTLLREELNKQDIGAARQTSARLADQADTAHSSTDGPLWGAVSTLPWIGDDVHAVQQVSAALDRAAGAVPAAIGVYANVADGSLRSQDGRIDLAAVRDLQPTAKRLSSVLGRARDEVGDVDSSHLLPLVAGPVRSAVSGLESAAEGAQAADRLTALAPTMLAEGSARTYLLAVQNNAEIRATGGLPGSFALLEVRDGKISMSEKKVSFGLSDTRPVLPQPAEEKALYGGTMVWDYRDTNVTPDFPRTGALLQGLVERNLRRKVDGVISVDPVALARMLDVTGPITVGSEEFTADNTVGLLLNKVYQRFDDNERQNAYFAAASRGIFDALVSRKLSTAVLRTVGDSVAERRVLLWSSHPEEQRQLSGGAIAGALPQTPRSSPQVGLYLNDAAGGKIEYYLDYTANLSSASCTSGGVQDLDARMMLTSNVPLDVGRLSRWVTGFSGGVPFSGAMKMNLQIYAPAGGAVIGIEANDQPVKITRLPHDGRDVSSVALVIEPGEQIRLTFRLQGAKGDRGDPVLQWTPGMRSGPTSATATSSCG